MKSSIRNRGRRTVQTIRMEKIKGVGMLEWLYSRESEYIANSMNMSIPTIFSF